MRDITDQLTVGLRDAIQQWRAGHPAEAEPEPEPPPEPDGPITPDPDQGKTGGVSGARST